MAALKRKRFQLTSLPSEEKQRLAGYIKQLGGTFIDTQIFSKQVTHVICGKANRGEKYLGGCALGKWVLQKEFVEDSYKQGSWLNEEKYEWTSDILDAGTAKKLAPLYNAPRKWRLALQNTKAGAFKSWNAIVHIQDNKMKKAYERLLEAGDATIFKKKISFQDSSSLPKDLTHVFVETKLRGDVLHLESKGIVEIAVHSPDYIPEYIIKGPKETFVSSNTIMKYNNLMNAYKIPRIAEIKKTVGALPGKENGATVDVKGKEVAGKRGVKRLSTDCDLCAAKRQKTMNDLPPYVNINSTQNVQKVRHVTFPGYVSNILESCMDEECVNLGMESVTSSLSSNQVPTSKWLHIIMNHFLLNAASEQQAFQSYHLLQNILEVHPPVSCQSLYLEALAEPINEDSQNIDKSTPWEFISKVIRNSLGKQGNERMDRMQSNASLLLKFFDNLLKLDGCNGGQASSIITRILWPSDSVCQSNAEIKEFVALCCEAVKLAVDGDSKLSICHVLLDWLSMAVTLKKRDDVSGQACESLAQQLFMEISKTDSYDATKLLLQGCHCSWLKMRILELILENFDKRLIPQEYKQLLSKTLKLNKIVLCYFFLLPNMKGMEEMKGMVEQKSTVARRTRKNGKGETPLHLACIRNDAMKVDEILKQKDLDVNMTDHAGWTALHEACNRGYVQCVKKILQYHEKTNKVNLLACPDDGVTVLHDAVFNNHLAVVKLLTQAGG
ncbi:SMC5-SMC6 complex localization factor 1-like [Paramuricea clavata]|uniref:SMC5-SMC6 complex localization factor 1-like n=1 Tax=Paramuricea clavata TaxID=317549 RepID=A0A7D9EHS0_PARCT|nr:SMC5-SMC6 complex localization factor 1-like [Paramuricea clavata]